MTQKCFEATQGVWGSHCDVMKRGSLLFRLITSWVRALPLLLQLPQLHVLFSRMIFFFEYLFYCPVIQPYVLTDDTVESSKRSRETQDNQVTISRLQQGAQ